MKKTITALLVILLLLPLSLSAAEKTGEQWHISIGSSLFLSQLGVSRDVGVWEFGLNVSTGLTPLTIYEVQKTENLDLGETEQVLETLRKSFTSSFGADAYVKLDLISSGIFDFDISLAIAGLYSKLFSSDANTVVGFALMGTGLTWNLNEHNGIYLETGIPFYMVGIEKDGTTGEKKLRGVYLLKNRDDDNTKGAAIIGLYFYARLGYRISF